MKKKIMFTIAVCILVVGIVSVGLFRERKKETLNHTILESEYENQKVTVAINTDSLVLPEYRKVIDEETGETVIAEVQENIPVQPKPTAPPEKPRAEGDYTNPNAQPIYTDEQIVVTQPPQKEPPLKEQDFFQKQDVSKKQNGASEAPNGQVYIEGFGYVSESGNAQTQTVISEGDINKQVGNMD